MESLKSMDHLRENDQCFVIGGAKVTKYSLAHNYATSKDSISDDLVGRHARGHDEEEYATMTGDSEDEEGWDLLEEETIRSKLGARSDRFQPHHSPTDVSSATSRSLTVSHHKSVSRILAHGAIATSGTVKTRPVPEEARKTRTLKTDSGNGLTL